MRRDKKAWLKILEVFIAIALIFSVTLIVYSKTNKTIDKEVEIKRIQRAILQEISYNDALRKAVLANHTDEVRDFIRSRMHPSLGFDITICDLNDICNIYIQGKDVYVDETVISSSLDTYGPKKLRLFVWKK